MSATIHYLPGRASAPLASAPKPRLARQLGTRLRELQEDPARAECFFCQRGKPECVCGQEWFQAARAIALQEGRDDEQNEVLKLLSGALDEMEAMTEFDPFEEALEAWHEADGLDEDGTFVDLHEWLNLTRREFALYATCSELAGYLYILSRVRAKAHREEIDDGAVRSGAPCRQGASKP